MEGDRLDVALRETQLLFLSTPSGWRATAGKWRERDHRHFYPRPPGGGRPAAGSKAGVFFQISIHALRVEGDGLPLRVDLRARYFYPRPPGGGRPFSQFRLGADHSISIHALRVEGDVFPLGSAFQGLYFYPRPPGGGRLLFRLYWLWVYSISIHRCV